MKSQICFLLLLFTIGGCQRQSAQPNNSANEVVQPTPEVEVVSDEKQEKFIEENFTGKDVLQLNGFTVKKIKTEKSDPDSTVKAEIFDAVITKNKKLIAEFEGVFYPLGNQIDFGLVSLLNNGSQQLAIVDTSNRYEKSWITDFSDGYKLLFDSGDYEIYRGDLATIDFDDDGIYEITLTKSKDIFNFPSAFVPKVRIIFQFDEKSQKFLPASHKFAESTLDGINEHIEELKENKKLQFHNVFEITLTYLYAGKESEGWKFFDENFAPSDWSFGKTEDKETAKKKIIEDLASDAIYNFIKTDIIKRAKL